MLNWEIMINQEELLQLRNAYIEIGVIVQKYGCGEYDSTLTLLMDQVNCIDSQDNDEDKLRYLVESYQPIFTSRGALGDFIVYVKDDELRCRLNEEYSNNLEKIWTILKRYII